VLIFPTTASAAAAFDNASARGLREKLDAHQRRGDVIEFDAMLAHRAWELPRATQRWVEAVETTQDGALTATVRGAGSTGTFRTTTRSFVATLEVVLDRIGATTPERRCADARVRLLLDGVNEPRMGVTVRVVRQGDTYGRSGGFTHGESEPLIELYDPAYAGVEGFHELGQFVARYPASTFMRHHGFLDLDASVAKWKLTPQQVRDIHSRLPEDVGRYGSPRLGVTATILADLPARGVRSLSLG
jgi:hypothetical protein